MREVLAYAGPDGEYLVNRRLHSRHPGLIAELVAHEGDDLLDVCGHIVGAVGARNPEKFLHPLAERHIRTGAQKIVLGLHPRAIIAQKFFE